MKYGHVKLVIAMLVVVLLLLALTNIAEAKKAKPFPYRIDNAHVVEKNHKITIEWLQTQPVLVTVYKLNWKYKLNNNCAGVETFGYYCTVLWQKRGLIGIIRVTDKGYRNGDEYYIQQNVYQSHNGGYGPFIPTYR